MSAEWASPTALVYYVAREPLRAREYVATSRAMMLATGMVALVAGVLLAPVLGHGLPAVTAGYRIAFGSSIVAFVGGSFTASLQARDLHRWNVVRLTQPAFSLIAIVVLWRLRRLTLDVALIVIARDHAAATHVGLPLLSAHGPGARARPCCLDPAAVEHTASRRSRLWHPRP